jgi:hypothetical protein
VSFTELQDMRVEAARNRDKGVEDNRAPWFDHVNERITRLIAEAGQRGKAGDLEGKLELERLATELIQKHETARTFLNEMNYEIEMMDVRPMSKEDALGFMDKISNIELNGKRLKGLASEEISKEIQDARSAAVYSTTARIQKRMLGYIEDNLRTFGLWSDAKNDGILKVNEDAVTKLFGNIQEMSSDHFRAAMMMQEVLKKADQAGIIKLGKDGIGWTGEGGQKLTAEMLEQASATYKQHTDVMHDIIFGTEGSAWRSLIPTKSHNDSFMDPDILGSTPIWSAIQTNAMHIRNDVGMQILTGKGQHGTENVQICTESSKIDILMVRVQLR